MGLTQLLRLTQCVPLRRLRRWQGQKFAGAICALFCTLISAAVEAHHGVAGVGVGGLEGPGAPIESATSGTLPGGMWLLYSKLDYVHYERFTSEQGDEADYAQFWLFGVGYGFTPWLSGYIFLPYHVKVDEPNGFDTRGFADISVLGQFGFKYDEGLRLIPANESLDDLADWHFTFFGGATLPTGDPNLRDGEGNIDPGKSTGFGKPSFPFGVTATKMLTSQLTFNVEMSYLHFLEYTYDDGNRTKFGDERRLNLALIYRLLTYPGRKLRLDTALELQYLGLGRDETNGQPEKATGGDMLYLVPGLRVYWNRISTALGVKVPVATWLNEESQQQGAEGKEEYRLLFTLSYLF
jgi:hypothetical protein